MRIIAGESRGTRLESLPGKDTRPTLERVKEGMFSAVQFWLPGAKVLDLYAGSGQLGLEALSRGAGFCVFVEASKPAARLIHRNAEATGLAERCRVVQSTVEAYLLRPMDKFDLILMDPPYHGGLWPKILPKLAPLCNGGALLLCESEAGLEMPEKSAGFTLQKQYRYGTVQISRYQYEEHAFSEESGRGDEEEAGRVSL